jgi:hypothetical protein
VAQSWVVAKEDVEPAQLWSPSMIVSKENLCILLLHYCVIKDVLKRLLVIFRNTD